MFGLFASILCIAAIQWLQEGCFWIWVVPAEALMQRLQNLEITSWSNGSDARLFYAVFLKRGAYPSVCMIDQGEQKSTTCIHTSLLQTTKSHPIWTRIINISMLFKLVALQNVTFIVTSSAVLVFFLFPWPEIPFVLLSSAEVTQKETWSVADTHVICQRGFSVFLLMPDTINRFQSVWLFFLWCILRRSIFIHTSLTLHKSACPYVLWAH